MDKKIEDITPSPAIKVDNSQSKSNIVKPVDITMPKNRHWLKLLAPVLGVLIVVFIILGVIIGIPALKTYNDAKLAYASVQDIKAAAKTQDIKKTHDSIVAAKTRVIQVRSDLNALQWTSVIPFFGGYTQDATHLSAAGQYGLEAGEIFSNAVEPYADLLGFKGQGSFTGGTAEDRIAKTVDTLSKVTPQIDEVSTKMAMVQHEIDQVDPNRYPETFQGKPVRSQIVEIKSLVDITGSFLTQARPMVKKLPDILGATQEKKYMVLFQNDKELRPTGGFITAYAIFRINKGRIQLDSSDDIYKLDDTLTKHVTPPDPISRYLNVYGWNLRDANFSPDYLSSMKTFEDIYNTSTNKEKIDGIIAMDTDVLVKMIDVLGPIPAYSTNFTTQKVAGCDCAQVIYELEKYADEPKAYERGSRKDIIGVLLSSLLKKALSSPKNVYGPLFQLAMDETKQKHVLIYLHDPDGQKGVEALNYAGRIKDYAGDYLHINDANLGGAKSNLYIVESVKQDVSITSSGADTTLTIEYRYPHPADNCSLERKAGLCLAGRYRDFVRVYLPKGASVSTIRGFENKGATSADLDHTVVSGFLTVIPQAFNKVEIKYKVPGNFQSSGNYNLLVQKQPGTVANHYKVTINGSHVEEFDLLEDKEITVKL